MKRCPILQGDLLLWKKVSRAFFFALLEIAFYDSNYQEEVEIYSDRIDLDRGQLEFRWFIGEKNKFIRLHI